MRAPRSGRGQHTIELVCALIFLVPLLLFFLDLAFLFFAGESNKQVCRDAARAAADVIPDMSGVTPGSDPPPRQVSGNDPTFRRAQSVVEKVRRAGEQQFTRGVNLETVTVDLGRVDDAATAALGGPIQGTVTVATVMTVRPPAPLPGIPAESRMTSQFTFDLTAVRQTTIIPDAPPPPTP